MAGLTLGFKTSSFLTSLLSTTPIVYNKSTPPTPRPIVTDTQLFGRNRRLLTHVAAAIQFLKWGRTTSTLVFILWVLHEQPRDEIFGQDAGAAEELLVKWVVHGRDVGQRLLLVVAQERRSTAQAAGEDRGRPQRQGCQNKAQLKSNRQGAENPTQQVAGSFDLWNKLSISLTLLAPNSSVLLTEPVQERVSS